MKLTEKDVRRYNEITNAILELKLGLFHITNKLSSEELNTIIKEIESDHDRINEFIEEGLNVSTAQRRFKDIQLTQAARNKKPDTKMNDYLIEASWCYVAGMFKACVALCRTAMEIGIRDQVNEPTSVEYKEKDCDKLIQEERKHWEKGNIRMGKNLRKLINDDLKDSCKRKEVPENKRKELIKSAHCIRIKGNIIVHAQNDTADREQETLDILLMTRDFLAEIYNL